MGFVSERAVDALEAATNRLMAECDKRGERIAQLTTALIEREAAIIWQQDQRQPWRMAREADREEFRGYAREQLTKAGLL